MFGLGSFDCGLYLADWCIEARGVDPAAEIRGRYGSLAEALELTGVRSLPSMFGKLLRSIGIPRTRAPAYGDIAVIALPGRPPRGAIITSGYVVIADGGGLTRIPFERARRIAAWSLHA